MSINLGRQRSLTYSYLKQVTGHVNAKCVLQHRSSTLGRSMGQNEYIVVPPQSMPTMSACSGIVNESALMRVRYALNLHGEAFEQSMQADAKVAHMEPQTGILHCVLTNYGPSHLLQGTSSLTAIQAPHLTESSA